MLCIMLIKNSFWLCYQVLVYPMINSLSNYPHSFCSCNLFFLEIIKKTWYSTSDVGRHSSTVYP